MWYIKLIWLAAIIIIIIDPPAVQLPNVQKVRIIIMYYSYNINYDNYVFMWLEEKIH